MDIVFVEAPEKYAASYTDYFRLIELSGFDICPEDRVDLDRKCIYVFSADPQTVPISKNKQAKVVWWILEWMNHEIAQIKIDSFFGSLCDAFWVTDKDHALLHNRLQFVRFGGHPGLKATDDLSAGSFDVAHQSGHNARRKQILDTLSKTCAVAPGAYGAAASPILNNSKIMLHIAQYPGTGWESLRAVSAAAHKMYYVCETPPNSNDLEHGVHLDFAEYSELVPTVLAALDKTEKARKSYADALFEFFCCRYTFRSCIEKAIRDL